MGNIDSQLINFYKSDKYKKFIENKSKSDPSFCSESTKKYALKVGNRMKEILREEILEIRSSITGEAFLDHIIINEYFESGQGWIVDVYFDEDAVTRNSLWWMNPDYENGAYLPTLFNEGYNANNYVYGYDDNGNYIRSKLNREGLHFIERAVVRFNSEMTNGTKAKYNSIYTGGTL